MSDPLDHDDDDYAPVAGSPPPPPPWLAALNGQQRAAVEALDGPVLVLAGAGTGKTRVLTTRLGYLLYLRKAKPWQVLSVTFTNKAAREMKTRIAELVGPVVEGMWLGTFHALATRILRRHAELVGLKSDFTILDADDQIRLLKQILDAEHVDEKRWPARLLMGSIQRWKDKGLTPDRLSPDDGGDMANGRLVGIYRQYQERLLTLNAADFGDLTLHCLTLFQNNHDVLKQYQDQFKYILVDEYQDTNTVQYLWLRLLAMGNANICCVGDEDQCVAEGSAILMADGARRPVEQLAVGDQVLSGYGSGDFRAATVAAIHRSRPSRPGVEITTRGGRRLRSTAEHMHFADYRLGVSPQYHFVYLMERAGFGFRIGVSQVYTKGQAKPVVGYKQRCAQEHADALWLIDVFDSETKAREEEVLLSLRFGIPTIPFVARATAAKADRGIVGNQDSIDRIFARTNSIDAAHRLLEDKGLRPEIPHYRPQSRDSTRPRVTLTLCADRRGATPMHGISMVANSPDLRDRLADAGFSPRAVKARSNSFRIETVNRDFAVVADMAERIRRATGAAIHSQARLAASEGDGRGATSLPLLPAFMLRPGMSVVVQDGGYDVVETVSPVDLPGEVFDLDILPTHNFIAEGIVTHNSIYGWRGAEIGNILKFEKDFPGATIIRLEQNYRSSANILGAASGLIARNEGRLGKTLWTEDEAGEPVHVRGVWDSEEEARWIGGEIEALHVKGHVLDEIAILVRAGFQTREFEERMITLGIPYRVVGGPRFYEREEIRDAIAYLRLIRQPADDLAFERIANKPTRGIGKTTEQALHGLARSTNRPLYFCAREIINTDELKPAARRSLAQFIETVERWRDIAAGLPLDELVETVLEESGYTDYWRSSKKPEAPGKLENLKELKTAVGDFDGLDSFLEHVSLVMDADQGGDADMVSIMTLHAAKGLEFETVFLPGWEEGLFPHQRALSETGLAGLEEERRLAYVGLTRAKKKCIVTHAANRRMHGTWSSSIPSRFIDELPKNHVEIDGEEGLYAGRRDSWGMQDRMGGGHATGLGSYADTSRSEGQRYASDGGGPGWRRLQARGASRPVVIDAKAELVRKVDHGFGEGERVFHQKFGTGTVMLVDGDHLTIDFDHAGQKKLVASFVSRA